MKKLILIGRSGAGKTTLTQAMLNRSLNYDKTQYVKLGDGYIDTPGEYIETRNFGGALAVYTYESDVVGLLQSAEEPFSLFPPAVTPLANRPCIGIITHIDSPYANVPLAEEWLKLAGCEQIFKLSSVTGDGIEQLKEYLNS